MDNYPAGVSNRDDHFDLPSVGDDMGQDDTLHYCPGLNDPCGDEVDVPESLCPACQRDSDAADVADAWAKETHEETVSRKQQYNY